MADFKNGWLSKSSAPRDSRDILVRLEIDGSYYAVVGRSYGMDAGWWCNGHLVKESRVTHWQPLPSTEV